MVLLRARTLATGITGARPELAEALLALLAHGALPDVPEFGSLGCSGDLAPLAHVAAALDLPLEAKEGLALVNGTDGMLGMLVLACDDLALLLRSADVAAAMSVEGLLGTDRAFAEDLVALRPHPGQQVSAANLRTLLDGSAIVESHRTGDARVQDAYSLRCAPQVHGAARDALTFAEACADRELASAIDNPVVLADGRVESVGNFHGAPLAHACDLLAIVVADVASMSERRTDRFLDASRSQGLPPFLAHEPGVDSGLMIAQYTAAALVAECKRLAAPASVDSIPTSALQEDHVSMGWGAHASCDSRSTISRRCSRSSASPRRAASTSERRSLPPPAPARPVTRCAPPVCQGRVPIDCCHLNSKQLPGSCAPAPSPLRSSRRSAPLAEGARVVRAPRGAERSCKGWAQEGALRMLMNNLDPEVAERPTISSCTAARDAPPAAGKRSTRSCTRCAGSRTTRRCWCSPASPWPCSARTSGRRVC